MWFVRALAHHLRQQEGAERPGIGVRQFKLPAQAWKQAGAVGLVSRQRGQASHNRMAAEREGSVAG